MQIDRNSVVTIEYTLRDPEGEVIDSSVGSDPLSYLHGHGQLIPGVEKQLAGQSEGAALRFTVPPGEGYGEYDENAFRTVSKANFGDAGEVEEGMQFWVTDEDGREMPARVDAIEGDEVRLDFNHPLAGLPLDFEIKVVNVREASAEELSHGHVHGPGGAHD